MLQVLDIFDTCLALLVCHDDPIGQEHQPLVGLHLHAGQEDHQHHVEQCNTLE